MDDDQVSGHNQMNTISKEYFRAVTGHSLFPVSHHRSLRATALLLLIVFVLVGCTNADAAPAPATALSSSTSTAQDLNPAIELAPARGYAGSQVSIRGTGWQPATLVTINLVDSQGQSPPLTASMTDANGQFQTGFLYPNNARWLVPGAHVLVASTADEAMEAMTQFTVVLPAGVATATSASLTSTVIGTVNNGAIVTGTVVTTPAASPTVSPTMTPALVATAVITPSVQVSPAVGGVNTQVVIQGSHFPAATQLYIYLTTGSGAIDPTSSYHIYHTTTTDAAGNYNLAIALPGTWPDGSPLPTGELIVIVATQDFGQQARTGFSFIAPTPTPTPIPTIIPTATPLPAATATPVASVAADAVMPAPLQVQALLEPLDCDKNRAEFRVVASATDADGNQHDVLALIKVPALEAKREPKLKVGSEIEVKFNNHRVEIKGPDPEALLAQIQTYGGLLVQDGQLLEVKRKPAAQQKFTLEDDVLQIEAPAIELYVIVTDANELTATATAEVACAEDKHNGDGDDNDDNHNDDDNDHNKDKKDD